MNFKDFQDEIAQSGATLVAVSKTHGPEKVRAIYDQGQRDFGENKVQELMEKVDRLPSDIRWHMIGHLQSNKVKYIAPFVHLIHSLDRISLAKEINKQGKQAGRAIRVLLQVKIAREDSKFGLDPDAIVDFMADLQNREYANVKIVGVMGMATFTDDEELIQSEFEKLEQVFTSLKERFFAQDDDFAIKSYGMSSDYTIALKTGSNMVRVGSLIFGERTYS